MGVLALLSKAVVAVVALLVVSAVVIGGAFATGALTVEEPSVESVDTGWGAVTNESTEIRTAVTVTNPNPVGVPGVVDVRYRASLNDVVLANGTERGVGLPSGTSTVELTARMDNDRIADWWVTHVNNGERSRLTVEGEVVAPFGVSQPLPARETTFETDILGELSGGGTETVSLQGEPFLVVENRTAEWGEATAEETPVTFTATVRNAHDAPISLDGFGYEVTMNGVDVGEGRSLDGVTIAPGETETVEVRAALDTPKLADWWATHVRNGETTNLSVSLYAVVEEDGQPKRVPFDLLGRTVQVQTDILGGGGATTRVVGDAGSADIQQPTVEAVQTSYGEVTADVTPVETTVVLDNPNEGSVNEFVAMEVAGSTTVNGVEFGAGSSRFDGLAPGTNELLFTVPLDNSRVPAWWARHVNNGERSTVRTTQSATVDVGITEFDAVTRTSEREVSTDILAGIESDEDEVVTVSGERVAVIRSTTAEWGQADTQTTPFTVEVTVTNERRFDLTVERLDYAITLNDVTVADRAVTDEKVVPAGETVTLTYQLAIDSQRMDEWWVSHVENGEVTQVDFSAEATVSGAGQTSTVPVDSLSGNSSFETNFLNATTAPTLGPAPRPVGADT